MKGPTCGAVEGDSFMKHALPLSRSLARSLARPRFVLTRCKANLAAATSSMCTPIVVMAGCKEGNHWDSREKTPKHELHNAQDMNEKAYFALFIHLSAQTQTVRDTLCNIGPKPSTQSSINKERAVCSIALHSTGMQAEVRPAHAMLLWLSVCIAS